MKLFKSRKKEVKLGFSSFGNAIIDGVPFIFGVESLGADSKSGFLISISGEAVDSGNLILSSIEIHRLINGKFDIKKYSLKKTIKNDGGFAYHLSLKNYPIHSGANKKTSLIQKLKPSDSDLLKKIENEIQFRFIPKYQSDKNQEVLIGVFPYENIINGVASRWTNASNDKDYFKKIYKSK